MMLIFLQVVVGDGFLAAILSAGGVAMLGAGVSAYRTLRVGARADERDTFEELKRRRDEAEASRDYWHAWAGTLEFVIRSRLGPEAMPERPPHPATQVPRLPAQTVSQVHTPEV